MQGCFAQDMLAERASGALGPAQAVAIDGHVASCVTCSQLYSQISQRLAIGSVATVAGTDFGLGATAASDPGLEHTAAAATGHATGSGFSAEQRVGRYVVEGVLGKGGMGVVYAAFDPELDRKVALKVLRPELAGGNDAAARLLREGRAIAKLAHPNVVAVFDVGTHDGSVFVAMELVDGVSLDAWLANRTPPWRETLGVFAQAGQGLIAAHAIGMVHRDFKPANVLMGKDGRVRVTDFGLARFGDAGEDARSGDAAEVARADPKRASVRDLARGLANLTQTGAIVGTPAYMAPEQLEGGRIDAQTDQFSFAVSLYEALYGARPFAGRTLDEIFANIVDDKVLPAPAASTVPVWLRKTVVRGLRAARDERYPSLAAMLDELRRDPDAVRKKRVVLAAGSGGVLGLGAVIALVVSPSSDGASCAVSPAALAGSWDQARRGEVERAFGAVTASYAKDTLPTVTKYLDDYAAAWVTMRKDACEATQLRGEQTAEHQGLRMVCLDGRLGELRAVTSLLATGDPEVIRHAQDALGALGPLSACANLRALTARVAPPTDFATRTRVDSVRARLAALRALAAAGKYREANAQLTGLVAEAQSVPYRPLHGEALLLAGTVAERVGEPARAAEVLTRAVQAAEAGRDDVTVARAWIQRVRVLGVGLLKPADALVDADHASAVLERMGGDPLEHAALDSARSLVLAQLGKHGEALATLQPAIATLQRLLPADHADIAAALNDLGNLHVALAQFALARKAQEQALAIRERTLGANHPDVAASLNNLGNALYQMGDFVAADAAFRRSLAINEAAFGPMHPAVATSLSKLGNLLREQAKFDEALALYQRALAIAIATLGANHGSVALLHHNIGALFMQWRRYPEAVAALETGRAIAETVRGSEHPELATFLGTLSQAQSGMGDFTAANASAERALAIDLKVFGPDHPSVATAHGQLGELYAHQKRYDDALAEYQRDLAIKEKVLGPQHPDIAIVLTNIAHAYSITKRYDEAQVAYQRALAIDEKALGTDHPDLVYDLNGIGDLYAKAGDLPNAVRALERALVMRDAKRNPMLYSATALYLGRVLWEHDSKQRKRAKQLVTEARAGFEQQRYRKGFDQASAWLAAH